MWCFHFYLVQIYSNFFCDFFFELFKNVLFNFKIFGEFQGYFSYSFPFNFVVISMLLNLLRFLLRSRIRSIVVSALLAFEKNVLSTVIWWSVKQNVSAQAPVSLVLSTCSINYWKRSVDLFKHNCRFMYFLF